MHFSTHIDLESATLCGEGGGSRVYHHPDFDNVLLKVPKHKPTRKLKKKISAALRYSKRRYGMYREWYSEYEEYLAAIKKIGHCPDYLPRYLGFVNTSLGTALVVEKAHDEGSKDVASTLDAFIGTDESRQVRPLLEDFFDKIARHNVVFRDLEPVNLCVIRDAAGTPVNITCVDGLGDFTLIRIRVWSKWAYRTWHKAERERLLGLLLQQRG